MTEASKLADMIEKTGLAFAKYASSEVNLGRLLYDNEVIAILSALRAEPLQSGTPVAFINERLEDLATANALYGKDYRLYIRWVPRRRGHEERYSKAANYKIPDRT